MEKEWFECWFGKEYKALYPHRDEAQAAGQVKALIRACSASTSWSILDVGCGSGRHMRGFGALGFGRVCGMDLSPMLLRDARNAGLSVARADMRRLPFSDGTFNLLTCFFTSFGYFATRDEDLMALGGFCRVVKPGGCLFLDLQNSEHVKRNLIPRDTQTIEGRVVDVERFFEGDQLVKRIRSADGVIDAQERVRLFSLSGLEPVLEELGLSLMRIFGDENGADFSPQTSPRMGLLLRRA
jgi:SAM-dependent methyltransferase